MGPFTRGLYENAIWLTGLPPLPDRLWTESTANVTALLEEVHFHTAVSDDKPHDTDHVPPYLHAFTAVAIATVFCGVVGCVQAGKHPHLYRLVLPFRSWHWVLTWTSALAVGVLLQPFEVNGAQDTPRIPKEKFWCYAQSLVLTAGVLGSVLATTLAILSSAAWVLDLPGGHQQGQRHAIPILKAILWGLVGFGLIMGAALEGYGRPSLAGSEASGTLIWTPYAGQCGVTLETQVAVLKMPIALMLIVCGGAVSTILIPGAIVAFKHHNVRSDLAASLHPPPITASHVHDSVHSPLLGASRTSALLSPEPDHSHGASVALWVAVNGMAGLVGWAIAYGYWWGLLPFSDNHSPWVRIAVASAPLIGSAVVPMISLLALHGELEHQWTPDHIRGQWELKSFDETPAWARENRFIRSGYRTHWSLSQHIASVTMIHNETLNIWTHGFGAVLFLVWIWAVPGIRMTHLNAPVAPRLIMAINAGGFAWCLTCSTFYHIIHTCTPKIEIMSSRIDYFGIFVLMYSCWAPIIWFPLECWPRLQMGYTIVSTVLFFAASIATSLCTGKKWRTLRTVVMGVFGLWGIIPALHAVYLWGIPSQIAFTIIPRVILGLGTMIMGVMAYIKRWPESSWPGLFDTVAASHQLWHVSVLLGIMVQWTTANYLYELYLLIKCEG